MTTYAKIIADSISPDGVRLTTVEGRFRRFVLAEANTHRVISKNSASSRAIPLHKQIAKIREDLAYPEVYPAEQKGMQGGDEIEDPIRGQQAWQRAAKDALKHAQWMGEIGIHKSVVNRVLEPFMWHTVVFTATAWDNFFDQRCSPLAQPEIRVFAEAARDAMAESTPRSMSNDLARGTADWHLPYIESEDWEAAFRLMKGDSRQELNRILVKVSAARCARVSYLTQDGKRDIEADLALYERLTTAQPPHWSPLEHVATPWAENRQHVNLDFLGLDGKRHDVSTDHLPKVGNLLAWRSLRTEVEAAQGTVTYR